MITWAGRWYFYADLSHTITNTHWLWISTLLLQLREEKKSNQTLENDALMTATHMHFYSGLTTNTLLVQERMSRNPDINSPIANYSFLSCTLAQHKWFPDQRLEADQTRLFLNKKALQSQPNINAYICNKWRMKFFSGIA